MKRFDPEAIDLAVLVEQLRASVGEIAAGCVVGRTRLRDALVHQLKCSQLEGEQLVDTMVGRGFLVLESGVDGLENWHLRAAT